MVYMWGICGGVTFSNRKLWRFKWNSYNRFSQWKRKWQLFSVQMDNFYRLLLSHRNSIQSEIACTRSGNKHDRNRSWSPFELGSREVFKWTHGEKANNIYIVCSNSENYLRAQRQSNTQIFHAFPHRIGICWLVFTQSILLCYENSISFFYRSFVIAFVNITWTAQSNWRRFQCQWQQ